MINFGPFIILLFLKKLEERFFPVYFIFFQKEVEETQKFQKGIELYLF